MLGATGDFHAGDPVRLVDSGGKIIARGLVNYDADEVPTILGRSIPDLVVELGQEFDRELVHRDHMVVKRTRA